MNILIFGGSGFIGRKTGNKLQSIGHTVIGADCLLIDPEEEAEFQIAECNVKKPKDLRSIIDSVRADVIYWFPAHQGYGHLYSSFSQVQCNGTYALFQVLNEFKKKYTPKRIILASSQAVYTPGLAVSESWKTDPPSVYGLSKLQQEQAFAWFARYMDIPVIGMRYSIVLGYGQSLQANESGILRNWYRALQKSKIPEIYGDGTHIRDFVHIDDVVNANILALSNEMPECESTFMALNVCGWPMPILQLYLLWRKSTDCRDAAILNKDVRPGGEYSLTSGGGKIDTLWGWRPAIQPDRQIQDFIDGMRRKEENIGHDM